MQRVNALAAENWRQFTGTEPVDLSGHLMTFPMQVSRDGIVQPLKEDPLFDINVSIMGKHHFYMPPAVTT